MINTMIGLLDFIFLAPFYVLSGIFSTKNSEKKSDVVIIHGFATRGLLFKLMRKRLENSSHNVAIFEYNSLTKSVDDITKEFSEFASKFTKFSIVAHSLGGIIALNYYIKNKRKVRKVITLGTPFKKSWLRKLLFPFPPIKSIKTPRLISKQSNFHSILSNADIISHPKHNELHNVNNIVVDRIGHVYMIFSKKIIKIIESILK